jgi:hypothetical protein
MASRIPFAGVSRLDGGNEDGIHLLWGLPGTAAWALDGFDIQRRAARRRKPQERCFELTQAMLSVLQAERRLEIPGAVVTLGDAACPLPLQGIPDEPAPGAEARKACLDLSRLDRFRGEVAANGLSISREQPNGADLEAVDIDGRRGLAFADRVEIGVDPSGEVIEIDAWLAAGDVRVELFGADGEPLGTEEIGGVAAAVRRFLVSAPGIRRVGLIAKGGRGVLFGVCRHATLETCWSFADPPGTRRQNPFVDGGATFTLSDFRGNRQPSLDVVSFGDHTGLSLTGTLSVALPSGAFGTRLTLVHFSSVPVIRGFDADGALLFERRSDVAQGRVATLSIAAWRLHRVEIEAPQAETLLISACFFGVGAGAGDDGDMAAKDCFVHDITFATAMRWASVAVSPGPALLVAVSAGEAIGCRQRPGSGVVGDGFDGESRGVDRILVYLAAPARSLRICAEPFADPKQEEADWQNEAYIAKGLQMPFRVIDPALAGPDDEWGVAMARLLPGESVAREHFDDTASFVGSLTSAADPHLAGFLTARSRLDVDQAPIDLAAWPFLLSLTTEPVWRRIIGLGFLDRDGLDPGKAYDYRISARFRRSEVEEQVFGFHTVPIGMRVPRRVWLGPIALHTATPGSIVFIQSGGGGKTEAGRRALRVSRSPHGAASLTVALPEARTSVVLEMQGGDEWEANDFGGASFMGGFGGSGREVLTFPSPVDTIRIKGDVELFAVRLPESELDAREPVLRTSVISDVLYQPTPTPAAPAFLGTVNLQTALPPPDAAPGLRQAPDNLGFRLSWPPVPASGSQTGAWPPDLAATPPSEALFYRIDRRDVSAGGAFKPLSDDGGPSRFFASRGAPGTPAAVSWGADLLALFPERPRPAVPVPLLATAEDALTVPRLGGPAPGTLFQYRIRSVDVIGRESADRLGSEVRLEKRRAPPMPSGPRDPGLPAESGEPNGVRARVIGATDPGLSADDIADLAGAGNAIIVEWGWHANQRSEDPFASEFRVYLQDPPFDAVAGTITGPHGMSGGSITVPVSFDRPVAAGRMVGLALYSNGLPFEILVQPAGTAVTLTLKPLATRPAARPLPGPFLLHPPLDGSELSPAAWTERVAVVPLTGATAYRHVIRDRLTLSATRSRHRVWVGVSAADNEDYRGDQRTSGANAGRPGNESVVAAIDATGRFRGRPAFAPPALVEDVPEIVTAEPLRSGVPHVVDLVADLPAGLVATGSRVVVERLALTAISRRIAPRPNGVRFTPPEGAAIDYTPAAAADQAELTAALAAGQPGAIAGKFLRAILAAAGASAETLWESALPGSVPFGRVTVTFPADPARYLFRVRLADTAGRRSLAGAVTESIYRVPDLAPPSAPAIEPGAVVAGDVTVAFRVRARFDLTHVAAFLLTAPAGSRFGDLTAIPAAVLRTPNLRGAYPGAGIRLRLSDGRILAPVVVPLAGAAKAPPDLVVSALLAVGVGRQAAVWALAVNRDGAVSAAAGPILVLAAPVVPTLPALTVIRSADTDLLSWPAAAAAAEVSVERSLDAGASWQRISGWLRPAARTLSVPAEGGADTRYRLALRTAAARAESPAVTPS